MDENGNTITNEELLSRLKHIPKNEHEQKKSQNDNGNTGFVSNSDDTNNGSTNDDGTDNTQEFCKNADSTSISKHFTDELSYALVVVKGDSDFGNQKEKAKKNRKNISRIFKNRKIFIGGSISLLLIFTLIYAFNFGHGNYEAVATPTEYSQIVKVSAEVLSLSVGVGQEVKKSDILVSLDKKNQLFALKDLEFSLDKMKVSLKDSKLVDTTNTHENSTVIVAEAMYNQALSVANQAAEDYANALELSSEGLITESEVNNYSKVADKAFEEVNKAKEAMNISKNSATTATLMIDIEKTENEIAKTKESLHDFYIRASHNGKVTKVNNVVGDVVSPGDHILKISTADEMYLVMPLPREMKNKINFDQKIKFIYREKSYFGKIKYIDDKLIKISIPVNCKIPPEEKVEIFF